MSISLLTYLAAVEHAAEGQFLPARILWGLALKLILSIKEGQNLDPKKCE